MDPDEQRAATADRWARAAAGWERRRPGFQRTTQAVSLWMVERLDLQPGRRVLELAAGLGDTGLLAAELVSPGGSVIISDVAEPMVQAAARRARELELANVETRVLSAEWIDLPAAHVDGVLCRWGLMLLVDRQAAVREMRRVLRPGGRAAVATWAAPEHNPWAAVVTRAMVDLGVAEPPDPAAPGMFALADPAAVTELLEGAGFTGVVVEAVDLVFAHESGEDYWQERLDMSPTLAEDLRALSPAEHHRLRDEVDARLEPFAGDDGTLRIPGRALVAAADA